MRLSGRRHGAAPDDRVSLRDERRATRSNVARSVSSLCSGLGRFGGERRSGLVGSTVLLSSRISSLKTRAVVSLVSHGVKVDLAQFLHREVLKGMSNCLSDRNSGLTFCTEANWLGPDAWIHRLLL